MYPTLYLGPGQTDRLLELGLLRPHSAAHYLLGWLQSQEIPIFLEFWNDQLPRHYRHHDRLHPPLRLPHIPQPILLNPDPHRNPDPLKCNVRHRHSRSKLPHQGIKIPSSQRRSIWLGHPQRRSSHYSFRNHIEIKTRLNRRIIHVL